MFTSLEFGKIGKYAWIFLVGEKKCELCLKNVWHGEFLFVLAMVIQARGIETKEGETAKNARSGKRKRLD